MIHKSIIFWITSYVLIIPFFGFAQSNQSIPVQLYPRLIPYPNHVTIHGEETLDTLYIHPSEKANGMPFFEKIINHPNVVWTSHKTNYIARLEPTLCKECYGLYITSSGIELIGGTQHALHLAQMTLLQLISIEGFPLRHLTIEDSPRFSYRGMHLDVCRHFFDVESIKKYLDFMSYYKYNYFHWHLTEDQGWRIEIKTYPKLQSIAT